MLVIKDVINSFTEASGQTVNYSKSSISFSKNVNENCRRAICGVLVIQEGNLSGNYLGLPSLIGRNKREILGFIKNKVVCRIKSWTNKFLSRVGKEILLKNVIQAIPTYALSVFLIPLEMGREIERIMNGFWWGCEGERNRGIRWKRWESLCVPKQWGGLGFRRVREFNVALLGKQAWRLIQNPKSLVAKVYKAKYYPKNHFLEAQIGGNPSFIWRSIMEAQGVIRCNYRWRVGDGNSIKVWEVPWLPNNIVPTPPSAGTLIN